MKFVIHISISATSGILLFLSFPPYGLSFLAWFGMVPLFIVIAERNLKQGFILAHICGMIFIMGIFDWILGVAGYTYIHHALLVVYLGSYFGFFALVFGLTLRRLGIAYAIFAAPLIWIVLEYIRSNFFFLALPWGILAHTQYQNPLVIQIASITGLYGISFLIVMVNAAVAALVYQMIVKYRAHSISAGETLSRPKALSITGSTVLLVAVSIAYGQMKISSPIEGKEIKVSLVQGNIEQEKKWDLRYASYIMKNYFTLTQEASKDKPDLIVWPETATPYAINRDPELYGRIRRLSESVNIPILLGSSQTLKFKREKSPKKVKYKNSAILISPRNTSSKTQRYDKVRLMPFGEYLPYQETIPWSLINAEAIDSYLPGEEYTVFKLPDARFSVTICWENLFPDLVRRFVKKGAQFIINMTNEAWFGETSAPYQFLSMSVFRAVENRIYVMRCANTGISCFIDPCGRVVDRVKDENGKNIFVRGVLTRSVIPLESHTFYTLYGDWLIWLSIACTAFFMILAIFRKPPD